jgi:hypothetical protein
LQQQQQQQQPADSFIGVASISANANFDAVSDPSGLPAAPAAEVISSSGVRYGDVNGNINRNGNGVTVHNNNSMGGMGIGNRTRSQTQASHNSVASVFSQTSSKSGVVSVKESQRGWWDE